MDLELAIVTVAAASWFFKTNNLFTSGCHDDLSAPPSFSLRTRAPFKEKCVQNEYFIQRDHRNHTTNHLTFEWDEKSNVK